MQLDFLSASDGTRLTKSFEEIAPGQYRVESYPQIARFTSFSREVATLEEFYAHLVAHAKEGLCLLKGELKRPIENESRAGLTDAHAATEWLCLDVDVPLDVRPKDFLYGLDPAFKDISFIAHASASHGIKNDVEQWRGHLYVMLDQPISPQQLKIWLIERNLKSPFLSEHLVLSAGGQALKYPLDVTTCQNDKLIYICPPDCRNFDDPIQDSRFEMVQGKTERATLVPECSQARVAKQTSSAIQKLRKNAGLETRKARIGTHSSGVEILKNPDPVTVTGKREARGFVYLNLNGGDSFAYYFPTDNPEIIYNFKGEPAMYMRDVDKDLLLEYSKSSNQTPTEKDSKFYPFVLRDRSSDTYYNGIYRSANDTIEMYPASSKQKLEDFLTQYGIEPEEYIQDWTVTFDPSVNKVIDMDKRWVNTFERTPYMEMAPNENATIPPVIDKILNSLCGTKEIKMYFINWLACILQNREKLGTAWIFQGVQGTGKGLLFSRILHPLIGANQCHEITIDRFDDQFNAYLEKNLLLFVDEANVNNSRNGDRTLNKLKNLITEETVSVRAMRSNVRQVKSYSNLVFASNQIDIIPLEDSDRRFNVAPRQENPLAINHDEVTSITNELGAFAGYLHAYAVDRNKARKVLLTKDRTKLIQAGRSTTASFFSAVRGGDLSYFTQYLLKSPPADPSGLQYLDFDNTVRNWIKHANTLRPLPRDEIHLVYEYLQNTGGRKMSPTKFSRMCATYALTISAIRTESGVHRGIADHTWTLSSEDGADLLDTPKSNVTPLRR